MNPNGLLRCAQYAYPPNSLSLCGPEKQNELVWYKKSGMVDQGTTEILSAFSTMYPYLKLIATANNIKDPFDPHVVDAYWIGNSLLTHVTITDYVSHLAHGLQLRKKLPVKSFRRLLEQTTTGVLPNHAYHVFAIWLRTGNIEEKHSIQTMNACMVGQGVVQKILPGILSARTKPLTRVGESLCFAEEKIVDIIIPDQTRTTNVVIGNTISFHWGMFVEKLSPNKAKQLRSHTSYALTLANAALQSHEKQPYLYHR